MSKQPSVGDEVWFLKAQARWNRRWASSSELHNPRRDHKCGTDTNWSCPDKGRSAVRGAGAVVSAYRDLGVSAVTVCEVRAGPCSGVLAGR